MKKGTTVFVGMSGGVDSSVAALRLKKQGMNVIGVFIKVWHPDFMICNWEQERLDAMRVAAHLEIPFLTCDAEDEYRSEVAEYFIKEYSEGRTPNPDVMCNKEVKFGAFIRFAKERNADFIATGHYAQKVEKNGKSELHRGLDTNKDQTYFLWTLTQEQLDYSLFPVGSSTKDLIRKEATAAKIPVANKQDSQGICFLGHIDIPEFLSHFVELKTGNVLDTHGNVIGTHKGALVYTLGQRHGFSTFNSSNEQLPQFVVARNIEANTITVSVDKVTVDTQTKINLAQLQLRSPVTTDVEAQFRYRQKPVSVTIRKLSETTAELTLNDQTEKPSVGQSCVLYAGTHCIGGGIIK